MTEWVGPPPWTNGPPPAGESFPQTVRRMLGEVDAAMSRAVATQVVTSEYVPPSDEVTVEVFRRPLLARLLCGRTRDVVSRPVYTDVYRIADRLVCHPSTVPRLKSLGLLVAALLVGACGAPPDDGPHLGEGHGLNEPTAECPLWVAGVTPDTLPCVTQERGVRWMAMPGSDPATCKPGAETLAGCWIYAGRHYTSPKLVRRLDTARWSVTRVDPANDAGRWPEVRGWTTCVNGETVYHEPIGGGDGRGVLIQESYEGLPCLPEGGGR